ncbi:TadE/TadG family type IV pilus assembly protein [Kiloniella sp. b19]|uniref:TadE/TadG family type IV pilus assembly protein n=1 Tax=Kiloniella sp. GXU_MW_B19 TaxID=3141326 RepID=UPI0031D3443A
MKTLETLLSRLGSLCRSFKRNERGGVLIEFGFVAPVLLLVLVGSFETARYIYTSQKIQRTAMTLADLASRTKTIDQNDINNLFAAAQEVAKPFELDGSSRIYISSVENDGNDNPVVGWQDNDGSLISISSVGIQGGAAVLPDNFLINNNQSIIVAEVYFQYRPVFVSIIGDRIISHRAMFRPRLSLTVKRE